MSESPDAPKGTEIVVFDGNDADKATGLIRRSGAGQLQRISVQVKLWAPRKEIYKVSAKQQQVGVRSSDEQWSEVWQPTARGYERCNRVCGIMFRDPDTLNVGDQTLPNPFIERNSAGVISHYTARKLGIGRTIQGNWFILDQRLDFAVQDQLISAIMRSWKWNQKAKPKEWAKLVNSSIYVTELSSECVIPYGPGVQLVVDLNHSDVIDIFKEHGEVQRFATRRAQTILERNILKKHPGLGVNVVEPDQDGCALVNLYGWVESDIDSKRMSDMAETISRGEELPEDVVIKATVVESVDSDDGADPTVSDEEEVIPAGPDTDAGGSPQTAPGAPSQPDSHDKRALRAAARGLVQKLGQERSLPIIKQATGRDSLAGLAVCEVHELQAFIDAAGMEVAGGDK